MENPGLRLFYGARSPKTAGPYVKGVKVVDGAAAHRALGCRRRLTGWFRGSGEAEQMRSRARARVHTRCSTMGHPPVSFSFPSLENAVEWLGVAVWSKKC
ncbi:Os07g0481650 [Oryza sativa Japonica Group]|uniref:Os07g0481650 protein n=1 Tax=Oryza sativa subsp. japonica TaxID=39947 RepID=A0A0P0X5S0_ORYSJ|nr:Os07g0481650 [Oryza sativa Japonica Group]